MRSEWQHPPERTFTENETFAGCENMKKLVYFISASVLIVIMCILYQFQLGAIGFFILSVIFFALAIKGFSGEGDERKRQKIKEKGWKKAFHFLKKPYLRNGNK